jgi:hypothetical protein
MEHQIVDICVVHRSRLNRLDRRGFALPAAIMALVILAVLITGAIYTAQQEARIGWSANQSTVAFNLTERGVAQVLSGWDAATYNALSLWDTAPATGTLPDGNWSATITKMDDYFFYVDVTGVVSRGGPLRSGATHRLGLITYVSSANITPPAALATLGSVSVRGTAAVMGEDVNPAAWGMCTTPLVDKPGIASDPAATIRTQGQGTITGAPAVYQDASITDDTFTQFGNLSWADLVQMATVEPGGGALNIEPSLNGDGTCNESDTENWGDPQDGGACESYFPTIFVNGSASIQGGGMGQGILLVAGDLDLRGGFSFYGLVIVQGSFETQGNGNRIYGAVLARNVTLGTEIITGGSEVQYSSCAVTRAILNSNLVRARALPNRGWVDVSYLYYN